MNDRVSVLVPCYNSVHLKDTIDSIVGQDYPDLELIIIDDGSREFDQRSIEEYVASRKDIPFKVMVNPVNLGTVRTLNRAFEESSGEYIVTLGGDDMLYDVHTIGHWVDEFKRSGALVVSGRRMVCAEQDSRELYVLPSAKTTSRLSACSPHELFDLMSGSNQVVGCSTAQRRECFEKYGLFDTNYRLIEDYPRYLRLSRLGERIHFTDEILVRYRQGGISSIGRYNPVYEAESDQIFENEILPFTDDPERARGQYDRWKIRTRVGRDLRIEMTGLDGRCSRFLCLCRYFLRSPYSTLVYLRDVRAERI